LPEDLLDQWEREAQQRKAAAKTRLFQLLSTNQKIATVEVEYDGYGDSGQIESIIFLNRSKRPVKIADPALDEAIDSYVFSLIPMGWENGAGAFGTIHIDVARQKTRIAHNTRFEDYETETIED
jgi:hypothetical protein